MKKHCFLFTSALGIFLGTSAQADVRVQRADGHTCWMNGSGVLYLCEPSQNSNLISANAGAVNRRPGEHYAPAGRDFASADDGHYAIPVVPNGVQSPSPIPASP